MSVYDTEIAINRRIYVKGADKKNRKVQTLPCVYPDGTEQVFHRVYHGLAEVWTDAQTPVKPPPYLCFVAQEDDATIQLSNVSGDFQISYNARPDSWLDYEIGTVKKLPKKGNRIFFKAKTRNDNIYVKAEKSEDDTVPRFKMTKHFAATGNIMSLLDESMERNDVPKNCFKQLFYDCQGLTLPPDLPAEYLSTGSYRDLFRNTSLREPPELSSTHLGAHCYSNMFSRTKISHVPVLPATEINDNCYRGMFTDVKTITYPPELPATTLCGQCYRAMFSGCTALSAAPDLPAGRQAYWCYSEMFQNCSSIISPPEMLLSGDFTYRCCYNMFSGCRSLTAAPELHLTKAGSEACANMFRNCVQISSPPEIGVTSTYSSNCFQGMFSGCSSLTSTPVLMLSDDQYLSGNVYSNMFRKCLSLKKAFFPNMLTSYAVDLIAKQNTFIAAAANIETQCKDGTIIVNDNETE